jgi:glycosyltransferase involved in cell wall biosynthesis
MRKRICIVVSTPITIKYFMEENIRELAEIADIYIVANFKLASFDESDYIQQYIDINIQRKYNIFSDLVTLIKFFNCFRSFNFDIIISITPKAGFLTSLVSRIVPNILHFHVYTGQVWANKKGFERFLLKSIDKIIARNCEKCLVDGRSQRAFLIKNGVVSEKSSEVLGNGSISGVDLFKFKPDSIVRKALRNGLNITDSFVIYYLGRLTVDKGILDLLKAYELILREKPNAVLVIGGPDEGNFSPLISNFPGVIYLGDVDHPFLSMQIADLFVLPSYREGFGNVVLEASALEIPVLVSDIYGLKDAFIEGFTGQSFRVGDVGDLTEKILFLIESNDVMNQLSKNARSFVESRFSREYVSREWKLFFKKYI